MKRCCACVGIGGVEDGRGGEGKRAMKEGKMGRSDFMVRESPDATDLASC